MNNFYLLLAAAACFLGGWFSKSLSSEQDQKTSVKSNPDEPLKAFDTGLLGDMKKRVTEKVSVLEKSQNVIKEDVEYCNFLIDSYERACENYEGKDKDEQLAFVKGMRERVSKLKVVEAVE